MPKVVDHDDRRAQLVRAVWAVIDRHGIEGATVRRVAERAGVSVGGLRHYFDSQHGLLRFAAEQVAVAAQARLARDLEPMSSGVVAAQGLLEELLPLDADRRVEADVWLACLTRFRLDSTWDDLRAGAWAGERHICRTAVALCFGVPAPAAIGDPVSGELEPLAARLHVVVDGLTLQGAMFADAMPAAQVRALLRAELDQLVPPPV
ncbi:TetR/AcrR family transcriptional regulator [Pseudonocardia sp. TRM90224]|uniref:TetR/AcrR family transcriptional regulator n=1 Tax=Pseudonocardia sp. TRM90224 TaxID=2812678 RepID=UPI001E2B71CC|nr:TetR/AcrR family transcriptional regulator [Pseudonocardia sp. TRM90224]